MAALFAVLVVVQTIEVKVALICVLYPIIKMIGVFNQMVSLLCVVAAANVGKEREADLKLCGMLSCLNAQYEHSLMHSSSVSSS